MSNREKIYRQLVGGAAMGSAELAERTGLPRRVVQDAILSMRQAGFIDTPPIKYSRSPAGQSMLLRTRRPPAPVISKSKRAERAERVVRAALSGRPALDACWSVGA